MGRQAAVLRLPNQVQFHTTITPHSWGSRILSATKRTWEDPSHHPEHASALASLIPHGQGQSRSSCTLLGNKVRLSGEGPAAHPSVSKGSRVGPRETVRENLNLEPFNWELWVTILPPLPPLCYFWPSGHHGSGHCSRPGALPLFWKGGETFSVTKPKSQGPGPFAPPTVSPEDFGDYGAGVAGSLSLTYDVPDSLVPPKAKVPDVSKGDGPRTLELDSPAASQTWGQVPAPRDMGLI